MNVKNLHTEDKAVSAKPVIKSENTQVIAIQIKAGEQLKEHISKVPALLLAISGEANYTDEQGVSVLLKSGDYVNIEPLVKHAVNGITECQLVLIKF
jgi:quercetin dioxygenase-like cupin family protein